ncbi:MAG: ATP-binding protein, partial [Ginsengibacter sp.]
MGPDFKVDIANSKIYELWGTTEELALGNPLLSFLPEARTQGFEDLLKHVYNSGETYKSNGVAYVLPAESGAKKVYLDLLYEAFRENDGSISGIIVVATDVTEQVLNYKKTEEAELKARMAIESADLGLYELDLEGGLIKTDERFNEIFGIEEIASRTDLMRIFHPEDLEIISKAHEDARQTGYLSAEYRIVHKDKSIHWVKSDGKIINDENGTPVKIYGVIQDMTSLKEINQQKDDYISIVSHELKTPVTSMRINSYLLLEKLANSDKQIVSMLRSMNYQVDRLSHIIQDLTDVTRLDSDKVIFRKEVFDFDELIKDNVAEMKVINQTDRIIINHIEEVKLFADKDRTGQVLTNLLTNALKYSPSSENVFVSLSVKDNDAICSVKDCGNGIKKEEQSKIFERFFQVSGNEGVARSGFGLGLYISAQIIERQKGKIWVESNHGEGSTFLFSLPLFKD